MVGWVEVQKIVHWVLGKGVVVVDRLVDFCDLWYDDWRPWVPVSDVEINLRVMWYLNWIAVVLVEMRHVNSNEHRHGYVR